MRCIWIAGMALLLGVTGCRHRAAPVLPVSAGPPVALEPTPHPKLPTEVASVPRQTAPIPTVVLPKTKPHHTHHKPATSAPVTPPTAAPAQVASAEPPPIASVIGSLSTGGDASVEKRQQATDLIADNEKRLTDLSKQIVQRQRSAVQRVSNFDRDATVALKAGDAEGAMTLAKKAQVLLDDLEK